MSEKKYLDSFGFWKSKKLDKNGNEFYQSSCLETDGENKKYLFIFENQKKEGSNQPDYRLVIPEGWELVKKEKTGLVPADPLDELDKLKTYANEEEDDIPF